MIHSTEHPPDYWTWSIVLNILHITEHHPQYWTSSRLLNIIHSTEHPPHYWTSSTVLNIFQITEYPPKYWKSSTLLNFLHSTPQHFTDVPWGPIVFYGLIRLRSYQFKNPTRKPIHFQSTSRWSTNACDCSCSRTQAKGTRYEISWLRHLLIKY